MGDSRARRVFDPLGQLLVECQVVLKDQEQSPQGIRALDAERVTDPIELLPLPIRRLPPQECLEGRVRATHELPRPTSPCTRRATARPRYGLRTRAPCTPSQS